MPPHTSSGKFSLVLLVAVALLLSEGAAHAGETIKDGDAIFLHTQYDYFLAGDRPDFAKTTVAGSPMRHVGTFNNRVRSADSTKTPLCITHPAYRWKIRKSMTQRPAFKEIKYGDIVYLEDNGGGFLTGNRSKSELATSGTMHVYTCKGPTENEKKNFQVWYQWRILSEPVNSRNSFCSKHGQPVSTGDEITLGCLYYDGSAKPPIDAFAILSGGRGNGVDVRTSLLVNDYEKSIDWTYTWNIHKEFPSPANRRFQNTTLGMGYNLFADQERKLKITSRTLLGFHQTKRREELPRSEFFREGNAIDVPTNLMTLPKTEPTFESSLAEERDASEMAKKIETSLGVEGGYAGVKAELEVRFGTDTATKQNTTFIQQRELLRVLTAQFDPTIAAITNHDFQREADAVAESNSLTAYQNFFAKWGTHYVHRVTLGAECRATTFAEYGSEFKRSDISVLAKASFSAAGATGGASAGNSQVNSTMVEKSRANSNVISFGGASRGPSGKAPINATQLLAWKQKCDDPNALEEVERQLTPVWQLVAKQSSRRNFKRNFARLREANRYNQYGKGFMRDDAVSYNVRIKLRELDVIKDGDGGAKGAGDIYWAFATSAAGNRSFTLDYRNANSNIELHKGNYTWDKIKGTGPGQIDYVVKPDDLVQISGYIREQDGKDEKDDLEFGKLSYRFKPSELLVQTHCMQTRMNGGNGDVTLHWDIVISPNYPK